MDERTLNELLECSVCLDRLDASSKVLPCQHTFCRRCLQEIVCTKQELRCPECRALVEMRVEELPSNILLIRLLEGMKTVSGAATLGATSSAATSKCAVPGTGKISIIKSGGLSQPCAKALYNYEAKEQGDLTFKKGEMIVLKKQVDENWFHGELDGKSGFFPATYVQVLTALPQDDPPKCKALYDFIINDQNEKDCLTFHKDEVITVIRRVDEHWAEGKLSERIGIFPISFVDFNDSAKWLLNNPPQSPVVASSHVPSNRAMVPSNGNQCGDSATSSKQDVAMTVGILITTASSCTTVSSALQSCSNSLNPHTVAMQHAHKRHSLTTFSNQKISLSPSQHRHSMELPVNSDHMIVSNVTTVATPVRNEATGIVTSAGAVAMTTAVGESSNSPRVKSTLPAIYIALYNYKPQKVDEVELTKGGYYTVSEKCQDGWYKGACLRTGRVGVFPGNYVQMVRLSSAMKSSMASAMLAHLGTARAINATHSNVARTHSFPKTSPHHKGPSNDHNRSASQGNVKVPSRTITNVTQAQSRSVTSCVSSITTAVPLAASPRNHHSTHSPRVTSLIGGDSNPMCTNSGGTNSGASNRGLNVSSAGSRDMSQVFASTCGSGQSPRSARRHRRSERSKSNASSLSHPHNSTTSRPQPTPDVVVGVMAGDIATGGAETPKQLQREKKERKESKDRLTLIKRLASHGIPLKGRRSKSPPPQLLQPPKPHSKTHQRSGSEGSLAEGAVSSVSCIPTPNKKFDSKSLKIKPREKYRCIDAYPPQSDIELELKQGDIVYIHKKREDGWFKGTHARTGRTGLFPGCFVDKL